MPSKSLRHAAIRARAERAVLSLYHAATPRYPRDVPERDVDTFQSWFDDAAMFEVEYLNDGGPYGRDYARTLAANCNAGRFKSDAARRYYIRKGLTAMARDIARSPADRITDFGTLYTWGRGGRTLAPEGLVRQRGGGAFAMRGDWHEEMPIADVVQGIRTIEAFTAYVEAWCAGVPDMWAGYVSENTADAIEAAAIELATD